MPKTTLMPSPRLRFFDSVGHPLANGMVFTYAAGTSTPLATFTDPAGTIPHKNPIRLDAHGEATVYWSGNYRVDVRSSTGTQVRGYPVDNYNTDPGDLATRFLDFAKPAGSSQIGYQPIGESSARTVQDKLRETVSVKDFGAKGDGTTDDTAAIQRAINSIPPSGGTVFVPVGLYMISSSIIIPLATYNLTLAGAGYSSTLRMKGPTSFDLIKGGGQGFNYATIQDLQLDARSLPGAGNLIFTNGLGTMALRRLMLSQIPINGSGILVNGINGEYNHDTILSEIYVDSNTGFAGIQWGGLSADGSMTNVQVQGRGGMDHPVYFAAGASHHRTSNLHSYGGKVSGALGVTSNADALWFTDCFFDSGPNCPTLSLVNASLCHFSNCTAGYGDPFQANVALANSNKNVFFNTTFQGGDAAWAVRETGTSDHNVINGYTIHGAYSAVEPFVLVGKYSRASRTGAALEVTGQAAMNPGSTVYVGAATSTTEMNARVSLPGEVATRRLVITCSNPPGDGNTFTATVFLNGQETQMRAVISGTTEYSASMVMRTTTLENDFNAVSIRLVSSAGAAVANVFANLTLDR